MTSTVQVALVQLAPVFLNLSASVARAEALVREAASQGAAIIVFPEAWLPGYPVWLDHAPGSALWGHAPAEALFARLHANAPAVDGPEIGRLAQVAVAAGIDIVIGLSERRGASLYNSAAWLGSDGAIQLHRKLMPTHNERMIWAAADGSRLGPWPTRHGIAGALICWEHWMPLARAARHATGEDLHFALWPAVGELHQLASRHYAFEGQCFVIASGCVLTRDDVLEGFDSLRGQDRHARELLEQIPIEHALLKDGGSAVIGPDSGYLAAPAYGDPSTIHAELDLARLAEGRLYLDTSGHYARPDIFELRVDMTERPAAIFQNFAKSGPGAVPGPSTKDET